MFWGNKILEERLPSIIAGYSKEQLDRATYRLRIGPEVYVSPTGVPGDLKNKTKLFLNDKEHFVIPTGQFAFLLTEEVITIPDDVLAFISIRAKYKFRGLVNISGFHVDPEFSGRLVFSVFNAGPSEVHLERNEECFHIWFADLKGHTKLGTKPGYDNIPPELIGPVSGELQSLSGLNSMINDTEKKLENRMVRIEKEQAIFKWAATVIVTIVIGLGIKALLPVFTNQPTSNSVTSSTPEKLIPPAINADPVTKK